ncbi:glycosyltransferase [Paracoccus sp. MBLB3053]|uniref:Glycosyltransferase n=1 Tax=Paracoccus aurantius TaxID=3073814 RepID=A0ABU2HYG5_9RHOB|nr:glycosyltransferase [Paracoccus sp. MBLB3053]MDS9470088.1 glycosyltransferase [Paracoccus sp. MBLB3053]
MIPRLDNARILMYSHDTFGLGHLRRCREIAHALVDAYHGLSVMIISGTTIAGAFDYRVRVDFVKIPSVIKLRNGEYQSMAQHTSLEDTLEIRRAIIRHTAETFRPDIFITDKEPMGLHGEIEETLAFLKTRGTRLVLGLREIMDAPEFLGPEWERKDLLRKVEAYYDAIWVYGPEGFHDPLSGLAVSETIRSRMRYTGFLRRSQIQSEGTQIRPQGDYLLVTTGGGGDGAELIQNVFAAHRQDRRLCPTFVVLGPYLPIKERAEFIAAAADLPRIEVIEFDNRLEDLVAGSVGVVGMGGYNTFCEILSFDRPALIVPRTRPRMEQAIRALRAEELGLARVMPSEVATDPERMAKMLRDLPTAPRPSLSRLAREAGFLNLNGQQSIAQDVGKWLRAPPNPLLQAVKNSS